MNDVELVEEHRRGCNDAFGDLVRRNIGWIYGAALRRMRDSHAAEDVSQSVFIILHRKLPRFKSDRALMVWLHKTTRYATEVAMRARSRRMQHEARVAMLQNTVAVVSNDNWENLSPVLDELIGQLPRSDREAILFRFYRQMAFPEIASRIGITSEAARKRVDRAIEKLRVIVDQRGIAWSTVLLGDVLARHVLPGVPAELATTIGFAAGNVATGVTGVSTLAIVKGTSTMMTMAQLKIAVAMVAGIIIVGGAASVVMSTAGTIASAAADPFPKVSPFSAVNWSDTGYRVNVNGKWYELIAINEMPAAKIIQFAQNAYPDGLWQKRIDEDLVEVMERMGAAPGNTVTLKLRATDGGQLVTLANIAMTSANRWAIWDQRNKPGGGPTTQTIPATQGVIAGVPVRRVNLKVSPFSAVRWKGATYEVEVRGRSYELVSIEGESTQKLVSFSRRTYGELWQKRVDEDLPEVLAGLGHASHEKVKLELRTLDTHELIALANVPMTPENRRAIWERRNSR